MTHERVLQAALPPENLLFEGKSYDLEWDGKRHLSPECEAEAPALPSADFAMYLINAVKFHCGQLFHLFEEEKFMERFSSFYENPTRASQSLSLWYIHYLLILAFGKAFVVQSSKGRRPPGADMFVHAMKLLPNLAFYSADPIESIQVLCCAALYLQCLDFRGAAYRTVRLPFHVVSYPLTHFRSARPSAWLWKMACIQRCAASRLTIPWLKEAAKCGGPSTFLTARCRLSWVCLWGLQMIR